MTKEELQKKNAILEEDNKQLGEQEEKLREDISRALNNYTYEEDRWTHQKEKKLVTLSWSQIFTELGKLLERQKRLKYVEDIEQYRMEQKENNNDIRRLNERLEYLEAGNN